MPPAFRREIYRELGIFTPNLAAEEAGLRWAQHYEFKPPDGAAIRRPDEVREVKSKASPVVASKPGCRPISARVPLTEIHQGDFSACYTLKIMLPAIGGVAVYSYTESDR